MIKQVGVEFNKAKAKGLVEGTLQKYIQPSYATATPEQQINAIQQMVRDGIDGILLLPLAGPPLAPSIDAAGKAGVPVVILDNVVADAKYAVNVWSQNNSPAAAGVAGLVKTGNVLFVRGIAGNPVEQAFQDAAVADVKACPGLKIVGTIYGKWTNATAKAETVKWLAAHPDTKIDAVIQNGIMMAGIVQAFQQTGRPVPPISGGGCQGGDLSWWLKNKATYKTVANCFNGFQTGWSEFRLLCPYPRRARSEGGGHPHPGPDRHERQPAHLRDARQAAQLARRASRPDRRLGIEQDPRRVLPQARQPRRAVSG